MNTHVFLQALRSFEMLVAYFTCNLLLRIPDFWKEKKKNWRKSINLSLTCFHFFPWNIFLRTCWPILLHFHYIRLWFLGIFFYLPVVLIPINTWGSFGLLEMCIWTQMVDGFATSNINSSFFRKESPRVDASSSSSTSEWILFTIISNFW